MTDYMKYKSRRFNLRKDADAWAKKEKKRAVGSKIKIDINYHAGEGTPWEAVLLMRN